MFSFPDITGSVGSAKTEPSAKPPPKGDGKAAAKPPANAKQAARPPDIVPERPDARALSPAERAILERLRERRTDIEARARSLDMRESLIKAAEKRLEEKVKELKQVEGRINAAMNKKEEAEAARFKGLVSMYENMKAKDAARIFDRLNIKTLVEVASHINPRRMGDILAQMSPEAAERLTIEFASKATGQNPPASAVLPKIEGRPTGP